MSTIEKDQNSADTLNNKPQIIEVPLEKLSVPLSHPRRNMGNMETLQSSIRRNGLLEPITVCKSEDDDSYMVIDGTRRLTVFTEFGRESVPCIVVGTMPLGQIAHFSYEKNMERRSLSPIEIALHIKSMQDKYGYSLRELDALGYGSPALISQKVKLLDLPASVKALIESGQLTTAHGVALGKLEKAKHQEKMAKQAGDFGWTAKRLSTSINKLLAKGKTPPKEKVKVPAGDVPGVYFKDAKDMSELPDKSVHLIVTSPPYCIGMEFEKGISYADHWENMKEVMAEASRVLVPGGIMALNVGDIHNYKGEKGKNKFSQIQLIGHKYQSFMRRHQVYLTDVIAWVKSTYAHSRDVSKAWSDKTAHTGYRILISHDPVYIFRKAGEREVPSEEAALNSRITKAEWDQWAAGIWMIDQVRKMDGHPAIFPDELAYRLVRMFSYEGDTVLDPFLGSGTTVKVARELNREGIGYERELQYKPVIMAKLGVAEEATSAGSMAEFAKQTADIGSLELAAAEKEAVKGAELFRAAAEVQEPVTVG